MFVTGVTLAHHSRRRLSLPQGDSHRTLIRPTAHVVTGEWSKQADLKQVNFSPFVDPLRGEESAAQPHSFALVPLSKALIFILSSGASSSASRPPPSSRPPGNQRSHNTEPLVLFSANCFHRRKEKRTGLTVVVTSQPASFQSASWSSTGPSLRARGRQRANQISS